VKSDNKKIHAQAPWELHCTSTPPQNDSAKAAEGRNVLVCRRIAVFNPVVESLSAGQLLSARCFFASSHVQLPSAKLAICNMSLPSPQSSPSGAALGEHEDRRRKHPRHAFMAWLEAHPARHLAGPEFVAELTAHPLYCRASRSSVQRWEVVFRCRAPSQAHAQQWHVYGIDVGLKKRSTLLARAALCELLVLRLMRFRGACRVRYPQQVATCVVSRRHFLISKNLVGGLLQEGQRMYEQQRFIDAAKSWGQAALLQHAASHAFLSDMLIEGRPDVANHTKRAFELAAAGAAMGCAHSKGALGRCLVIGAGVAKDVGKGLALARESAASGSCFGQFVVGWCYQQGVGIAQNYAEAMQLFRLAAAQGHASAQSNLGIMFSSGQGVAQDYAEAARWWYLAAVRGDASAQCNLGVMFRCGVGVAQDYEEALRLYRLAAAQGHANAQNNLGLMFHYGQGVAQDDAEAIQWFRLAAAQGHASAVEVLKALGS
jgi:TPR repeat protein